MLYITRNNKHLPKRIYTVLVVIVIVAVVIGSIGFLIRPDSKLMLCWLFSSGDGETLRSVSSPDGSYVVHIVEEECSQVFYVDTVYDCSTRLDIETENFYKKRVYTMTSVCDAKIM